MKNHKKAISVCIPAVAALLIVVLLSRLDFSPVLGNGVMGLNWLSLVLLATALGTDALSLTISIGIGGIRITDVVRVSAVIGVFHVVLPLVGILLGHFLGRFVGEMAAVIGALLVGIIGLRMIWGCLGSGQRVCENISLAGWPLVLLALAVSMDAFAVGFGLGVIGYHLLIAALVFGLFSFIMSAAGLMLGNFLGRWIGSRAEVFGGVLLLYIAVEMAMAR